MWALHRGSSVLLILASSETNREQGKVYTSDFSFLIGEKVGLLVQNHCMQWEMLMTGNGAEEQKWLGCTNLDYDPIEFNCPNIKKHINILSLLNLVKKK